MSAFPSWHGLDSWTGSIEQQHSIQLRVCAVSWSPLLAALFNTNQFRVVPNSFSCHDPIIEVAKSSARKEQTGLCGNKFVSQPHTSVLALRVSLQSDALAKTSSHHLLRASNMKPTKSSSSSSFSIYVPASIGLTFQQGLASQVATPSPTIGWLGFYRWRLWIFVFGKHWASDG